MNTAAVQQSEVSDVSAWVALYHRASTVPSTPLVNQEVYNALVDGVADVRDRAVIMVLMESGLRATELVLLGSSQTVPLIPSRLAPFRA